MTTPPNSNSTSPQQQYDILQRFDNISMDHQWIDDHDTNELMDVVDFDHVYIMEKETPELEPMEEQNLSQKLSLLSTSNTTTTNEKEFLLKDIKDEIEKIPNYLTKQNKSFKQMISQALPAITTTTTTDNNIEELRKIAILIYKSMIIQTYHQLWTAYLKSGMGQLIIQPPEKQLVAYSTNVPIWPKEIKTMVLLSKNMDKTNENENYLEFVNNHLHELDNQLKQYHMELNLKTNHFRGYTLTIKKLIETYIEQNLHCLRMKIEHQIELIYYDYHIRALKLEYFRHNPTTYQQQLMKEICQSKYEQETSEQELDLLKEQITYYHSSNQSFQCSSIAHCPLLDSIQNPTVRQQLYQQYKEVAEQSRANIFALYMKSAEDQRDEYKKKYNTNKQKMWNAYHSSIHNEKIDSIMLGLIHQRCEKMSARIKCIYKFKISSIVSNSKS